MFGIKCLGIAGTITHGDDSAPYGQWLLSYDPEAYDGHGWAEWTDEPSYARGFVSTAEALAFYQAVPMALPVREDGKPNRPLLAFTVSVERLPD